LRLAPQRSRGTATYANQIVESIIDQSEPTSTSTTEAALDEALQALDELLVEVKQLYDPTPGEPAFVPDANAIIWNPDLEEWTFDEAPRFSIVLTSTLLGELDDLKMPYRGESVRLLVTAATPLPLSRVHKATATARRKGGDVPPHRRHSYGRRRYRDPLHGSRVR
jgi:hypothetical protein